MSSHDDTTPFAGALQTVIALAGDLPAGDVEHHVQVSAQELAVACSRRDRVDVAVERFAQSVRQLQQSRIDGPRRRQQEGEPAIERLLETFQEDLLPELRRVGLL